MKPEWCSPIADQDLVAFAKEVVRITQQFEHDPAALRTQTTAARENITATYTRAQLRIDLADAFSVLTDAESEARQPAPASVTHWSVPVGPRGTLVRARRRVAASLRRRP
jgi:hypothetical protein